MNRFIQNKRVLRPILSPMMPPPSAPRNIPAVVMAENVAVVELSVQPSSLTARELIHQRHYSSRPVIRKRPWQTSKSASGSQAGDPARRRSAVLLFVPSDNVPFITGLFIKVVSHDDFDGGFIDHGVKPFAPLRQANAMRDHWFDFDSAAGEQANGVAP